MQIDVIRKIGVAIIFLIAVGLLFLLEKPKKVVYDCDMAEWHPDIPVEVKKECRKLRAKHQPIRT